MELHAYLSEKRGRASALATSQDVSPVTIHNWAFDDDCGIPVERCPGLERDTGGLVTCEEMRSDVSWVRVTDSAWPHPDGRPLLDIITSKKAVA